MLKLIFLLLLMSLNGYSETVIGKSSIFDDPKMKQELSNENNSLNTPTVPNIEPPSYQGVSKTSLFYTNSIKNIQEHKIGNEFTIGVKKNKGAFIYGLNYNSLKIKNEKYNSYSYQTGFVFRDLQFDKVDPYIVINVGYADGKNDAVKATGASYGIETGLNLYSNSMVNVFGGFKINKIDLDSQVIDNPLSKSIFFGFGFSFN